MDLTTSLAMELRIRFVLDEEVQVEDVVNALEVAARNLGVERIQAIENMPDAGGKEFSAHLFLTIPSGQLTIAEHSDIVRLQTTLQAAFLAALRPPPKPEHVH